MPSPLNGLTDPAASPTTRYVGPTRGSTEPPVGRRPPVGGPVAVSGEIPHRSGAVAQNASIRCEVLMSFQPRKVERRPTPTLIVPSPTGKIHPYPGKWFPALSRMSRWLSIHGSSWYGLVK